MNPSYSRALAEAIAAAREAGALLRQEFHRPGGPRGEGDLSPVDAEAERLIRHRLTQGFPEYGVLGEELGEQDKPARDPHLHVWVIDPHDATATFIQGYRGSCVAIGLLRAGQPVLGVVYAFVAPDDRGDLLAWAEGCGPLTRNGEPVYRAPWGKHLERQQTILLNLRADSDPGTTAALVAPARFRCVASIDYRLALVAAGEAEVSVSLRGPCSWDFAAGHALLRAVGGDLFDEDGHLVRYQASGWAAATRVFGGGPALASLLAGKEWPVSFGTGFLAAERYPLATPVPGESITDPSLLGRAQGALLGQLAGDNLGSLVEFSRADSIAQRYPQGPRQLTDGGAWNLLAGQPTDDSEMALVLARTLAHATHFDEEAIAAGYGWWLSSGPFDVGATTRLALSAAREAAKRDAPAAPACRAAANEHSQANGALMRISPLGVWGHALPPERLAEHARADARLTHPHAVCLDSSAVLAVTIAHAVASGEGPREVYAFATQWAATHTYHADVCGALERAATDPPANADGEKQGWVLIALQNAFYRLLHAPNLEAGVAATITLGGDTDTNGCVAGALLGAVHGRKSVPWQWLDRTLTCRPISGLPGVHQPRPKCFWPVDAPLLAERLLVSGRKCARH